MLRDKQFRGFTIAVLALAALVWFQENHEVAAEPDLQVQASTNIRLPAAQVQVFQPEMPKTESSKTEKTARQNKPRKSYLIGSNRF